MNNREQLDQHYMEAMAARLGSKIAKLESENKREREREEQLLKKISDLKSEIAELNAAIEQERAKLSSADPTGKCPTCGDPVHGSDTCCCEECFHEHQAALADPYREIHIKRNS